MQTHYGTTSVRRAMAWDWIGGVVMAPRGDSAQFDHYRVEAEAMLAVGRPLGAVERMLERAPLQPEERSALWLFAWALHDNVGPDEPIELRIVEAGVPDAEVRS